MKRELKNRQQAPADTKPELKQEESEAQSDENQEPQVEEVDEVESTEESNEESTDEIDYKAELERVKAERDNYKNGLLTEKLKRKDLEREEEIDDDDEESGSVKAIVQKELSKIKTKEMLSSISDNPDEQALILEHYNNSINKSGYTDDKIVSDLLKAKALANAKKLERDNQRLQDSIKASATQSSTSVGGSNQSKHEIDKPYELNDIDKKIIENYNRRRIKRGEKPLSKREIAKILNSN